MKTMTKMGIAAFAISLTLTAHAGDPAAGKAKASACVSCHGMNGISMMPTNPNLAGQKEAYLVNALKAYRDGQRKNPMMSSMVSGLSDADIDDIAAYYASLK